jgi:hypothetical protein
MSLSRLLSLDQNEARGQTNNLQKETKAEVSAIAMYA